VTGSADATWNSVPGSKSVTGYAFLLNGAAISWRCKVQPIIAQSSAEAEFCSLRDATCEAVYLRNLLGEAGCVQLQPTVIHQDNQPCIHLAENAITSSRCKHFVLRLDYVRQQLSLRVIVLKYCATGDMPSDVLTKILPAVSHHKFSSILMGAHN